MRKLLALTAIAAMLLLTQAAMANTLVSTIDGNYGITQGDTPSLLITNSTLANLGTAYTFTNVQLTLHGYQGLNNGLIQSVSLPNIGAGTFAYSWNGAFTPANLFSWDYDDEYGGTPQGGQNNPVCVLGSYYCAQTGNFDVTFTAVLSGLGPLNGTHIFSQFSPINNVTCNPGPCQFLGWEGLDPNGWSETSYDDHGGNGPNGVLANIYVGNPAPVGAPEPSSLVLLGTGLIGIGSRAWKRFIG